MSLKAELNKLRALALSEQPINVEPLVAPMSSDETWDLIKPPTLYPKDTCLAPLNRQHCSLRKFIMGKYF